MGRAFTAERAACLRNLRRVNEQQEDTLAPVFDVRWGAIEDTHRVFVERACLRNLRRVNEQQEDTLAPVFDVRWGAIEDTHRVFVERFLSKVPPHGRVLDAACGTGKYFPIVLTSGRSLLGMDRSGAYLANARAKFSHVPTEKHDLQDLSYQHEFDGVMCIDAMEFVPPRTGLGYWSASGGPSARGAGST
jgi:2-polyprenyl-3-methyl-5-hydroxy-6-metoxy-1,4-benzoquinol methylase